VEGDWWRGVTKFWRRDRGDIIVWRRFFFCGTKVAIVIIITNECGEKDKDRFCRLESLFQEVGIMTKAKDVIMKI
jgi:hypothetical protein